MKTTKKQLEAMIRESVQKTIEGLDRGDFDWLQSRREDDAVRQNMMKKGSGSPAFGQMIQAATIALQKIQAKGDPQKTENAKRKVEELKQLSQAPESAAVVMKARMITGSLVALSRQG